MVASQADTTSIPLRIKDPRAGKSRLVTDCVVFSSELSGIPGGEQGIDEPLYLFERSFVTDPIDLEGTQSRPLCGGGVIWSLIRAGRRTLQRHDTFAAMQ